MTRKKTPRLPNGYGSIRKLSGARRNPYAVYPPRTQEDQDGRRPYPRALCYVPTWTVGLAVLTAYQAGTYTPGMEHTLLREQPGRIEDRIFADYARIRRTLLDEPEDVAPTFEEVFRLFWADKYETGRQLSPQSRASTMAAFRNCAALHSRPFRDLRPDDLQGVLDGCELKHSSLELIHSLFRQMYRFAEARELCDRDYSRTVSIKRPEDDEHGVPFTEQELAILWEHTDDPAIELAVIMCFFGYRISAYHDMTVNLREGWLQGGNKTEAGRDLRSPIHSAVFELVKRRIRRDGALLTVSPSAFRKSLYGALARAGVAKHTPHDCKHTFSALCERYGVAENDRRRLLGHKIGNVTNDVYGHRGLEELRQEVEKIRPAFLTGK